MLAIDASAEALTVANENYSSPKVFFCTKQWPFDLPKERFDICFCPERIKHV